MGASNRRLCQSESAITRNLRPTTPYLPDHWHCRNSLTRIGRDRPLAPARCAPMLRRMWPFARNSAHRVRSYGPYWLMRNGVGDARAALAESVICDIAIIGAGISGALIADSLVGTGRRIVMLDARDVALGSTAATTALLQYEIDTHLVDLVRTLGAERAITAYGACVASFTLLERRFPELLPLANYRRCESLYLAESERAVPTLQAELRAREDMGISCRWLEHDALASRFGCRRPGAILSSLAAQLDPVRFTHGLFAGLQRHGVSFFARTRVTSIGEADGRLRLVTANGHSVAAEYVVVAAGFESVDFLGDGFADIANTYALVTEPLAESRR